jgi:iron complex outermembrane recepter protein
MKQGYNNKFFCLNIYILSIFGCFLLSQEAQAESKEPIFNKTHNQLSLGRSLDLPPKTSTSAKDLLEEKVKSQRSKVKSQDIAQDLDQDEVTRVTGVEVKQTLQGLELILLTVAGSERLVPLILPEGNDLVIDLLDATLAFSIRNGVEKLNPANGINKITVNKIDESSIRVRISGIDRVPSAEVVPGSNLVLSVTPSGVTTEQTPEEEIEIIATGEAAEEEYFVPDADIGGKIDSPLRDVPQSIQVIPQQVIEDQQATGLEEVLENAAGVTFLGDVANRGFVAAIRGFDNAPILRDGIRSFAIEGPSSVDLEVANLERVEVLKGPATVVSGEAEPGGLINLVTKKPLAEPYYNLEFQLGNRNFYSPSIDLSGPLTKDGSLLYRFNALYRTEESFLDLEDSFDRFFIAPVVTWKIGDRTDLTVRLEYIDEDNPVSFGSVVFNTEDNSTIEQLTNNRDATVEEDYLNIGYSFEHRFSKDWQLRNEFSYIASSFDYSVIEAGQFFDPSTGDLTSNPQTLNSEFETYSLYTNINGKFNTGSVKHNLLFGVDLSRVDDLNFLRFDFTSESVINILDSEPDFFAEPLADEEDIPVFFDTETTTDRLGIFLRDQIDLLDNLVVSAGVRFDTVASDTKDLTTNSETNQSYDAVSPSIGIVYQPIEPISLYAGYSESFSPNFETDADGEPLEPETGAGFDAGIKAEIIKNRLSANLGYFNITKQNVAVGDPNFPEAFITTGEQQSKGFDFDLSGKIMPGWDIIASYAFIDAEVTEDTDPELVGNKLIGIPENSASLWTTYRIQSGSLKGLGFGGGFNFVGERQGGLPTSFTADSYFLTNAALFYDRDNWQIQLNFDNLFDTDFVEALGENPEGINDQGEPFTVRASFSATF